MNADDGCRLFAVDEAFWDLGSRRTLWRSERLPVGNGLRFHSLTSCRFVERHAFPRAPFRYPASGRAVLSNNFLEVGYNFLGFADSRSDLFGEIRRLEVPRGRRANFFLQGTKLNRNQRVKMQ
jgi:hypothetical protein